MRRRLVLWVVSTVLLTGLLIGVPLVFWADFGLSKQAQEQVQNSAERTVELFEQRIARGEPNDAATIGPYLSPTRQVTVTFLASGEVDVYGTKQSGRTATGTASGPNVRVDVVQPLQGSPFTIGLRILVTTLFAMVIAIAVSRRRAGKMADAMEALAEDAQRIGSGDTRPARRHGLAELDQVAQALDDSSGRVQDLVRTERAFTSDVTHQLRTPLTAISLRLDEVGYATDLETARAEALAAQEQVQRLSEAIAELHQAAVQREVGRYPFDLDSLIAQQHQEWSPVFAAQGRQLVMPGESGLQVMGAPGALGQVLATLLDNASVHGAGTVTMRIRRSGTSAVVEVADQGRGIPAELGARVFERSVSGEPTGSGLGLSLARALVEHMGGRLELVNTSPPVFGVFVELVTQAGPSDEITASHTAHSDYPLPTGPADAQESTGLDTVAVGDDSSTSGNTQRR